MNEIQELLETIQQSSKVQSSGELSTAALVVQTILDALSVAVFHLLSLRSILAESEYSLPTKHSEGQSVTPEHETAAIG